MLKIWGRNTSSNVQKAMWAIGELGLAHERIDVGGAFGKNKEPDYLAMNPNGLVPTLQDGEYMSVGIQFDRSLSRAHPRQGHARAVRSERLTVSPTNGWTGNCRWWDLRSLRASGA